MQSTKMNQPGTEHVSKDCSMKSTGELHFVWIKLGFTEVFYLHRAFPIDSKNIK